MSRTVTYDGIRYEVLDLSRFRSGYQGSSSLTHAGVLGSSDQISLTKSPHMGKRVSPERQAEIRNRLRLGQSTHQIVTEMKVHRDTVRSIACRIYSQKSYQRKAGRKEQAA